MKNLTYKIAKYPSRLNRPEVDAELAKAFSVWSDFTDLTFTQKRTGQVHIEIRSVYIEFLGLLPLMHIGNEPFFGSIKTAFAKTSVTYFRALLICYLKWLTVCILQIQMEILPK